MRTCEYVNRKIEQRRQDVAELSLLKRIERAEDLDRHAKKILSKSGSLEWLQDTGLNMLVYEMEDLEWRVFEVVYIIKPDYKDYAMLIPETDRSVLDNSYKLLRRLTKIDGYSQLNVRPITDLPRPCYLPRPIKGHLWEHPAPKPSCAGSFKKSSIPLPFAKENVMERLNIHPEIHNLIRRLHKAYAKLCTMVDQWFSPGAVKEYVKRAKAKGTRTHPTAKETVPQTAAMETATPMSSNESCPKPVPRRIRVSLPSPRPRLIHNNRYNKVVSSGYGRSKKKEKTATEDPKKCAKEILPKPESLGWLHDMDLNMLAYEMEDLEWRVFEVIYVIKPDYKDYSMLIPETDRPVLDDGYNLLQRLAKIDGYSELNVRPITDLPRPCYLPRPIRGYMWQNPAHKPYAGGFKQSRIPLPYQFAKVNVTESQRSDISPEIHDLIRRLHKAYGRLCTMVDQWFSPGTVKENVIQATAKGTPNHPTVKGTIARASAKETVAQAAAKENVTQVPPKETVTQATAKKSVMQATANETCPQPVPRRIRVPLPSPRPRLIHNNRYKKIASSGYGRCKTKPKPTCTMQTSRSFVSTRNNIAPSLRGQTCQTLQKDPTQTPKVDIRTVARLNGSRLPIPVKLSASSLPTTSSISLKAATASEDTSSTTTVASKDASSAITTDIRTMARLNGSKLPLPIKSVQSTSQLVSIRQRTSCMSANVRHPAQVTNRPQKPIRRVNLRSNLYNDIPSTGYGKSKPGVKTQFYAATSCFSFSTNISQRPVQPKTGIRKTKQQDSLKPPKPDIRMIARQNGSKIPLPVKLLLSESPTQPKPAIKPKPPVHPEPAAKPKPVVQPTPVLPKSPIQPKPPILPKLPLQLKSPVQPKSTIQPKSTVQSEPSVQPKAPVLPKHPVQQTSPIQAEPPVQPKQPVQSKQPVQPKSPVKAKSPTQLLLCPKPPSTPPPQDGRRPIRVVTPSLDPDKPCPIKPARGILKTLCERMDFREMDAMFETNNHPNDYPPLCQNLDRFFYRQMAPRRLVPMGLESWTALNRRKVQFDPESNDQFDGESAVKYEPDLEGEEFLELERQCSAEFENPDEIDRES
ncbi:uncharacterized protein LOC135478275 [Liolophura sinensis]|uniref:uncharacterized protein LOC135478275 n=1 Tax=Liolophura sinensis TaxID=3198878 RepID=UPI003158C4A9